MRGSSTAGSLYVSLHTSDPGEAGDQTTNETAYTNYARVAVARSGAGWTVSGNNGSNAAAVNFPACGASGATTLEFTASASTASPATETPGGGDSGREAWRSPKKRQKRKGRPKPAIAPPAAAVPTNPEAQPGPREPDELEAFIAELAMNRRRQIVADDEQALLLLL